MIKFHEFSTSKKNIFEKLDFLVNNNIELDNLIGTWLIFPCSQCEEYNKEKSVHVILSRCRTVDDFKRSIEHKELIKINEKLKAEKMN